MNTSPAKVLREYLLKEGLVEENGPNTDWASYVGSLPDNANPASNAARISDNIVAVMDTTPVKDGRLMSGVNILHYGLQVLVRAVKRSDGYQKCEAIAAALEAVDGATQVVGRYTYTFHNISQVTGTVSLGQEEESTKRRELFSINFLATIQEEVT